MNCKPGELAMVIRSEMGNEGRVVLVVRRIMSGEHALPNGCPIYPDDVWVIRGRMRTADERVFSYGDIEIGRVEENVKDEETELPFPDAWLRPIRDQDGEDETLQWASKPEGVTA